MLRYQDPTRLPTDWIWYRHEDAEDEVPPTASPNAVAATRRSRPRIYATLGSMAGGNDFGRPVFAGMLSALGRLDADVLFTIGPLDPAAIGQPPANVTVSAYEPQSRAMRCDAAVIHAGSGTTVAALARGLPLVAVPMFADQMHNADRLVAARLAVRVDPGEVGERLTAAVETVLADPAYATNAQRVAEAIAARPTPGQALDLLRTAVTK